MARHTTRPGAASVVRRRALLGTAVLTVLVALAGLAAYLTRDDRGPTKPAAPPSSSRAASSSPAPSSGRPSPPAGARDLPVPPKTHDPVAYGKAAAAALWSYDTRAYSQVELRKALHGWLTREAKYADPASVDNTVPSAVLWKQMAANHQFAKAQAYEGHFPHAFTQALQQDPGAITEAYIYAVTVSGKQSIAWKGPAGGAESRSTTLAVQCRPHRPCALVGVMPSVAP
ncbi:hypothetical protein ACIPWL_28240 [Streptomyces sp. NPDC090023]|uniref:hypothetical protein n=1 Tax=unclassified Streptomyces TaxID=2593676 RepID=UPI003812F2A3